MRKIEEYVNEYKEKSKSFVNEEEVRIATNELLKEIAKDYKIDFFEEGHERSSIHGGRADSIYSDIIIEYKSLNLLSREKGKKEALDGRDDKDRGLRHYLINFTLDEYKSNVIDDELFVETLINKVGIGFDGKTMIFARYIKTDEEQEIFDVKKTNKIPDTLSKKQKVKFIYESIEPLDVAFKKLLLLLRSTSRLCLSCKTLTMKFGPGSKNCREFISHLYSILTSDIKNNSRIKTLYVEWLRIFGDIYGKKETDFTSYRKSLSSMYGLDAEIDPQKTLFVIQTYYNIVLKMLINNLLQSLTNPTAKPKSVTKRNELMELFKGNSYSKIEIDNFFEIHFFEWFIFSENFNEKYVNEIEIELDNFETTTSIIKSEVVEDVLRDVYANLIPIDLRHLMGEYYTCGWLVDFTLDMVGYYGDLNTSVLDPTCGSGSFITHAIKRLRKSNAGLSNKELIEVATSNIVGYDINPIAVISAKTNYLLSLGDISDYEETITIPIYMCDSVLVPTVYAKQNAAEHSIMVKTSVGTFKIPVMKDRFESDMFLKKISECIYREYSFKQFFELTKREGMIDYDLIDEKLIEDFYEELYKLHLSGRNGYWAIILKNAFAPLFSKDGFDLVVGNPPWIGWKSMSDTYRKQTLDIWLSYNIFDKSAYDKITSHDDFAMAVVYVAMDHYVKQNGVVGFVLPQTFVKSSKGGEGFRKLRITRDNQDVPFSIDAVYDMEEIKPFRKFATNKTSVMMFKKNKQMNYPMDNYFICKNKVKKVTVDYYDSLDKAMSKMVIERQSAKPVKDNDIRSPWLTLPSKELKLTDKFRGNSEYTGRKGIEPCGAKGTYLINIMNQKGKLIIIENLVERARLKKAKDLGVHVGPVEPDLVYPMVGGRNICKWGITSYIYMLVPHNNKGEGIYRGIKEEDLKVKYPKTYEWLFYFKELLLETRIRSAKFFDEEQFPWYRLDNVGEYTFKPYHVVWREQNKKMTACVIGSINDKILGEKVVVTDSKVLFCACDNKYEAHYICAIINAPIISDIIDAYTIDTQRGVDILNNIAIPSFNVNNLLHMELAQKSISAHTLLANGKLEKIEIIENEINEIVKKIFV